MELDLLDLCGLARALDIHDAVEVAQNQAAVDDLELVAVEPSDRRTGDADAFLVVRASVARADKAGRGQDGRDQHVPVVGLDRLLLLLEDRSAWLHRTT